MKSRRDAFFLFMVCLIVAQPRPAHPPDTMAVGNEPRSMRVVLPLLVVLLARPAWADGETRRQAPSYTSSSIVNAASSQPGSLAPNELVTLYGTGLSYVTRGVRADEIVGGVLPTYLSGTGVRVFLSNIPAQILYVSPRQVNFLVPANLRPGAVDFFLSLDGRHGPVIPVLLDRAAPGLFASADGVAIAVKSDAMLVSRDSPAAAGDVVVLYATGLGETTPPVRAGALATEAARLESMGDFQVWLGDRVLDASLVLYAGLAPGFAGLYQINLRLPGEIEGELDLRVVVGERSSTKVKLPVRLAR